MASARTRGCWPSSRAGENGAAASEEASQVNDTAKYQILLVFLWAGGSGLASVAVVYLAIMRLTDDRQRLRIDRLTAKAKGPGP
jgi:hypothetical protein